MSAKDLKALKQAEKNANTVWRGAMNLADKKVPDVPPPRPLPTPKVPADAPRPEWAPKKRRVEASGPKMTMEDDHTHKEASTSKQA